MNTHIIIPIDEVENKIKLLKKLLNQSSSPELSATYDAQLNISNGILSYRQISLDGKDIDKIVSEKYPLKDNLHDDVEIQDYNVKQLELRISYKQALLDLKK